MDQTGEERNSNRLVHSDQWSPVKEALSGVSILYANSTDVQGQFFVFSLFSEGKINLYAYMYISVLANI